LLDLSLADMARRLAQDDGLEQPASREDLLCLGDGGMGNEGAAVLLDIDKPLKGKRLEGGTNEGAADIEQAADVVL
jgi:hypothetical protein